MMERIGWLGPVARLRNAGRPRDRHARHARPAPILRWRCFTRRPALLGLWMMVRRSVRAGRPARLLLPLALSLAGPALIALLIRQRKPAPVWIDTLFVASGFLAFSACVIVIGTVVAWRRREADRDRRHRDMQASARRRLVERPSSGPHAGVRGRARISARGGRRGLITSTTTSNTNGTDGYYAFSVATPGVTRFMLSPVMLMMVSNP